MMSAILLSRSYRLTYADCDPAGIVFFASYYPFMERTYAEWLLQIDVRADQMPEVLGITTVSRASGCEYFSPGLLYDAFRVDMSCTGIGNSSFTFSYDFVREDEVLLSRGYMAMVCLDPTSRRPVPIPARWQELIDPQRLLGAQVARA